MTMYSLRPIIRHDDRVNRSDNCMYKMKNIHGDTRQECRIVNVTEQVINFLKSPLPEVAALECRQERILLQLAELKEQVLNLCDVLKDSGDSRKVESCGLQRAKREPVHADLVLNVNPLNPSYSIIALKKLWSDVDFRIKTFKHCSVKLNTPQGFKDSDISCGRESVINILLIWKKVNDTELVISGLHGDKILGEVNFLRYLGRLLDNYESLPQVETMKIDRILDISHQLIHQDHPKDQQSLLNLLDQMINKENWFLGDKNPRFPDLAVWSSLKQISSKSLPSNLSNWFKKCEKIFIN